MERTLKAPPAPGIYPNLTMDEYLAWDAVSAGLLGDVLDRSPRYAEWRRRQRDADATDATIRGTAIHYAVLQPDDFFARYAPLPEDYNGTTTAGRAAKAKVEHAGKIPLKHALWQACQSARLAAWNHPQARSILEQGETEVSVVFDAGMGLVGKARPDVLARDARVILDLKTTTTAEPRAFARVAANYGYHRSAPWYRRALQAVGVPIDYWLILALEYEGDCGASVFSIPPEVEAKAEAEMLRALGYWAACAREGAFHSYETSIVPLPMPSWLYKEGPA
jgi:hypothetical protein